MKSRTILSVAFATTAYAQQTVWGQCGGINWSGPTTCVAGTYCFHQNDWYYQCLPGAATSTPAAGPPTSSTKASSMTTISTKASSTKISSSTITISSTKISSTTTSSSPTATVAGKVEFAGVNIAGFDFGCQTDGSCNLANTYGPVASLGNPDGAGQMQHFVRDDHMNIFRLPVAWQFLTPSLGGSFNQTALAQYDLLMQACLATGAYCIIDIHNYARWNGGIIGQGGPTNAQFASLWSQLATKYASSSKVVFGIMNEPHDMPSITTWAASVQAAVTAIRSAGATSQIILLPGTDYTSASNFISNGSGAALMGVVNLDGSITNLIFDVHKYLDSDNSGTHSECVTSNVPAFTTLATWLRSNRRQALLSETGGGNVQSCETYLCQEIAYLNANSDVYLGYIGWGAGSFSPVTYILAETPTNNGGSWTDQPLVKACLAR